MGDDLLLFFTALVMIYLTPGPDMILLLGTSVSEGVRHALAVALGLAVARGSHVLLAAVGLGALFEAHAWAYNTVRLIGAAYLLYLGWQFFRNGMIVREQPQLMACVRTKISYVAAFKKGLATNLLNPKSLIFCSVLLPQFIQPERSGLAVQFTVLALILVLTGLVFDIAYAALGRVLWGVSTRNGKYYRAQNYLFSLLMAALGVKLGLS